MSGGKQGSAPVWAIVVHYGLLEPTRRALAALRAGTVAPDRFLVVDNQGDWPEPSNGDGDLIVVRTGGNIGFAGAAVEGARRALAAGAAWLWYVNNDALVDDGCLAALLAAAADAPDAGILSPLIAYPEGGLWYAGGAVDERTYAVAHETAEPTSVEPYDTGYITGCAMFARAAALAQAGTADAGLFMYFEDADLSLRVRARGWRLLVVPPALALHDVARRHGRRVFSPTTVYLMTRNRLVLAGRRGTLPAALPAALDWAARQVLKAVRQGTFPQVAAAAARGLRDGVRGVTGPPPGGLR